MNKIIRYIQIYLIGALPFVIACMVWSTVNPNMSYITGHSIKAIVWLALAFNLMAWFIALILFLVCLIVFPSVREKTLRYLANLKERDEREQYITGKAARSTYISTLSLLIFFLFFSIFSVSIEFSPDKPVGKRSTVNVGLHFSLLEKGSHPETKAVSNAGNKVIFDSTDYTPSKTAIILILIAWQLMTFNITARREQVK